MCKLMLMCSPLESPIAASPPNPAAEDVPLSTDASVLTDRIQTQVVCRGPSEVPPNFVFPKNESLTAIVQIRNLALRGHTETLYSPSNGNFLKEVELMAQFDPILKEHLNHVHKGTSSHTLATKYRMNSLICVEQQGHFNNDE